MGFEVAGVAGFVKQVLAARMIVIGDDLPERAGGFADLIAGGAALDKLIRKSGLDPVVTRTLEAAGDADRAFAREPGLNDARAIFAQLGPQAIPSPELVAASGLRAEAVVETLIARILGSNLARDFAADPLIERYFRAVALAALSALYGDPDYVQGITPQLWQQTLAEFAELKAKLDGIAEASAAIEEGIPKSTLLQLARRINADVDDRDTALIELTRAVEVARNVQAEGRIGSNLGGFVDEVLRRVAELSAAAENDAAAAAIDAALAREEAESTARQTRLLDAGLEQDTLRRDAPSAARRLARRTELDLAPGASLFAALRDVYNEWYRRGRDSGLNFELAVAIALAHRTHGCAKTADERGTGLNDLGNALAALGEREAGTARIEEAVLAYRAALIERTGERVPIDRARTQGNLGVALATLGQREAGASRLEEAVVAFRAALGENIRERMPLDWAAAQNNLGSVLQVLGTRKASIPLFKEAIAAHRAALEELPRDRVPLNWAATQNNLCTAMLSLGDREFGTIRLEEAVTACRAALEEATRDLVPLDWAGVQMNLGSALMTLGERESGTARLADAVVAYRKALEEITRDRAPFDWANVQTNLVSLELGFFDKTGTQGHLDAAAAHLAAVREVSAEPGATQYLEDAEYLEAEICRRRGG